MSDFPPLLDRHDYHFDLVVVSPLHIGSGQVRANILPPTTMPDGREIEPGVAAILRDSNGRPYIPGTALKGALAQCASFLAPEMYGQIFGEIKGSGNGGRMGALLVRGTSQVQSGDTTGLPWAAAGVFVQSRSALHSGLGVAHPNRLFHAEMVAAGARFPVRLRLETRGAIKTLESVLLEVLGEWTRAEGISIGADAASGLGRVRIASAVRRTSWHADGRSGRLIQGGTEDIALAEPKSEYRRSKEIMLRLTCCGPFLTRDPAWTEEEREKAKASNPNSDPAHIRNLRHHGRPFVTGQGVSGGLRARLEWLCALARQRSGDQPAPGDQSAERLFGSSGQRGMLSVSVEEVSANKPALMTSVRIDRFSGGYIDQGLFSVDADTGVTLSVRLTLDNRASGDDENALRLLVDDLTRNGLALGHGVNRGFGWFRVAEGST